MPGHDIRIEVVVVPVGHQNQVNFVKRLPGIFHVVTRRARRDQVQIPALVEHGVDDYFFTPGFDHKTGITDVGNIDGFRRHRRNGHDRQEDIQENDAG